MKVAILLLFLSMPCYAVEKLEAEGRVSATIISQELAEVTPESGTAIYDNEGNVMQVVF